MNEAFAQDEAGDVEILNFALTLEFFEADFYRGVQGLSGEVAALARTFGDEEAEHVAALTKAIEGLGGTPASKPQASFPNDGQAAFLKLAQTLEDTGVSAYNGAAPRIQSKEVLAAAGSIVQVEARHAASIRLLNGEDPAPSRSIRRCRKSRSSARSSPSSGPDQRGRLAPGRPRDAQKRPPGHATPA